MVRYLLYSALIASSWRCRSLRDLKAEAVFTMSYRLCINMTLLSSISSRYALCEISQERCTQIWSSKEQPGTNDARLNEISNAPPPDPPSRNTVDYLIEQLRYDAQVLGTLMGQSESPWDFQQTWSKFLQQSIKPERNVI